MTLYTVYTSNVSYKPEFQQKVNPVDIGSDFPIYLRRVRASSRTEALTKCLPDIKKELPKVKGKYLSVFVGLHYDPSSYPGRLMPIQIVVETGEIRGHI